MEDLKEDFVQFWTRDKDSIVLAFALVTFLTAAIVAVLSKNIWLAPLLGLLAGLTASTTLYKLTAHHRR
ncbi:MAG: hypothetical protein ABIQ64_01440 [Candidatus Saccharimonadales bacterium]